MLSKRQAAALWRHHKITLPVDLRRLIEELELVVVTFPFGGRVTEAIVDNVIGVRAGLTRPWFRWYVAHAMGHYLLHVGGVFHLEGWQWSSRAKAERQAEEFAGWLMCGPSGSKLPARELVIPDEKAARARELATTGHLWRAG